MTTVTKQDGLDTGYRENVSPFFDTMSGATEVRNSYIHLEPEAKSYHHFHPSLTFSSHFRLSRHAAWSHVRHAVRTQLPLTVAWLDVGQQASHYLGRFC